MKNFAPLALVVALAACTGISSDQTARIDSAVDGAMRNGDSAPLVKVLAAAVVGKPDNVLGATSAVLQRISLDYSASSSKIAATSATSSAIATLVKAAPAQAGSVMAMAQSSLPPDLQAAAVTAAQDALLPAAGGAMAQMQAAPRIVAATKFGASH